MMREAFSGCHPAVNFMFYIGAFVMGMCLLHPIFLVCSIFCSMAYYLVVKRWDWKFFGMLFVLFLGMALINPLFNLRGEHVLFTYGNGRPYTWEAICYGMAMASIFVTVLTWFATYNEIMTSDKFLYCFGKFAPTVTLILTMVLRLVPEFQKKTKQIGGARKCIGMSVEDGTTYEKAEHGLTLVSALTSWALEGGVVMADSMRNRGFGCGKRTTFSIYKMRTMDRNLLLFMLVLMGIVALSALKGGTFVEFVPAIKMAEIRNVWTLAGVAAYFVFLSIPTFMNIMEELRWRILRSKI